MISPDLEGWYALEGFSNREVLRQLAEIDPVEKLSVTKIPLVTVNIAQRISCLSVGQLWLWCNVTRGAMSQILRIRSLHTLDVLNIRGPGRLANFGKAKNLRVFRANCGMSESDLLEIARCETLCELAAQSAVLSHASVSAILALPNLTALDLEGTRFDDNMAKRVSQSELLTSLDIGATKVTRKGLEHLVQMEQLRSLDLWANELKETDLRLLVNLPNLEYLSLGNYDDATPLNSSDITQLILDCPRLKRVWLDGIPLESGQRAALEAKLDYLRITLFSDVA